MFLILPFQNGQCRVARHVKIGWLFKVGRINTQTHFVHLRDVLRLDDLTEALQSNILKKEYGDVANNWRHNKHKSNFTSSLFYNQWGLVTLVSLTWKLIMVSFQLKLPMMIIERINHNIKNLLLFYASRHYVQKKTRILRIILFLDKIYGAETHSRYKYILCSGMMQKENTNLTT